MTLKRLLIVVAVLIVLAGGGMIWLGFVAYTPQGRARIIIAQLKGDETSLHGWLLKHHVVKPGFSEPPDASGIRKAFEAASEMAKLNHEVLPVLIEALHDDNRDVRLMVARACMKFPDPIAIVPLVRCVRDAETNRDLTEDLFRGDYTVEVLCMYSLAQISLDACDPLLDGSEGCDSQVRSEIPATLVEKWGPAAIPKLMGFLEHSEKWVRAKAACELGKLKVKRAVDALVRHLSDTEEVVGVSAAKALGNIGDRKTIGPLLKTLKDKEIENTLRISAAGALARMGQEEGLQYLKAMIESSSADDRINAAAALGFPEIPGALYRLLSLLDDDDCEVLARAVEALGDLHDPLAIPAIKKILDDATTRDVADAACKALEKLGVKSPPASQPDGP